MATKFGIRGYSRTGNVVTFTLVALNADGSVDTGYTGTFTWGLNGMSDPGTNAFTAANMGQLTLTTTILNAAARTGLAANFPGSGAGANLSVSPPSGTNVGLGNQGDHYLVGGIGADNIGGNNGNDFFRAEQGGNDSLAGAAGDDIFYMGAALSAGDVLNGGAGDLDQVALQGSYGTFGVGATPYTFSAGQFAGIENLVLLSGNDTRFVDPGGSLYGYNLKTNDGNVAADQRLYVSFNTLQPGENVTFDGSAELDGHFWTFGGQGIDRLVGSQQDDAFFFGADDRWSDNDYVDGQGGTLDQLALQGDYSGANAVVLGAGQLTGIEMIVLLTASDARFATGVGAYSYDLTMADDNVGAGTKMAVSANTLLSGETLAFDGSAETDGWFVVYSGAGDDSLTGGAGDDQIWGGGGADVIVGLGGVDHLRGGDGSDRFVYLDTSESTAAATDRVFDFDVGDILDLSAIDADGDAGNGDTVFTTIGDGAFTGTAGELRISAYGASWLVEGDTTGDGVADMVIQVGTAGDHVLSAADFWL